MYIHANSSCIHTYIHTYIHPYIGHVYVDVDVCVYHHKTIAFRRTQNLRSPLHGPVAPVPGGAEGDEPAGLYRILLDRGLVMAPTKIAKERSLQTKEVKICIESLCQSGLVCGPVIAHLQKQRKTSAPG